MYRPPGPARLFLEEFTEFLSSTIKLESVLILGDFNLRIDGYSLENFTKCIVILFYFPIFC